MKLVRKTLLGLAAFAVVIGLTSCADLAGKGSATGTKSKKTITVDGTASSLTTAYRRYIKQIGSSEKIAAIKTTITIDKNDCILTAKNSSNEDTYANVGFIFDMNKTWDSTENKPTTDTSSSKLRDFVLFGFQPLNKKAYVEHYHDVNFKEELDTDETQVGAKDKNIFGNGSWASVTEGTDYTYEDGVYTLEITISQTTLGTYEIKLGNRSLGTYTASGHYTGTSADNAPGYAIGAVAGYVNCPKGTKVKATYTTDSKSVTGKFEAEEYEE